MTNSKAASVDVYPFTSQSQAKVFFHVTQQLRCLVCQNEALADSNAPLAQDLRAEIYRLVQEGKNVEQIKNYAVARYGNFILFEPPINRLTLLLWFGPFILLAIFIIGFFLYLYRLPSQQFSSLAPEEESRLQKLLTEKEPK